ncbi:hypothetical protein [Urechidicola croceus]|uniref:DUF3575 domain-containing protein n=1 Tax=Urechidicola croceus TaxID=1850246 RepID=A0A1D8PA12_9FLAO|nr:hypothetical protein [Urechidicola croceus]AOW21395.1 hypothetical protein LPB138_12215 [Urechidicola croceus]
MKKITLITLLLVGISTFAQEKTNEFNHEVKIDGAKLAFATIIEVSYENVNKKSSGYGISLLINPRESDIYFEKFSITPFYRMYFFNKEDYGAKGLFVEGFTKFSFGTDDLFYEVENEDNNYFDAAIGIAIGKKWVNSNGFILEIFAGGGRVLGFSDYSPEGFFRGGISIGKRF